MARDPAADPPQPARPRRRRRARAAGGARRRGGAGADAPGEPGRARRVAAGARRLHQGRPRRLPLDPVTRCRSCRAIVPLLDQARALPFGVDAPPPPTQWFPGLSQTDKLGAGAREVYRHALQHVLLPRLIVRLEGQMRAHFEQPAFLYEATRVYLMLGSAGPLDRDLIKEWMSLDWQAAMAGPCGEAPARQPGTPPGRAARPAAGEGAARRRADRGRAPHVQPRDRWRNASTARSAARSRRGPCRRGGRPTPLARPACACSSAAPARR